MEITVFIADDQRVEVPWRRRVTGDALTILVTSTPSTGLRPRRNLAAPAGRRIIRMM